jgi:hypothetical protein
LIEAVEALRVELRVTTGAGPIVVEEHGGAWVYGYDDFDPITVNLCTSGWSVNGPDGSGVITAGHCELDTTYGISYSYWHSLGSSYTVTYRDHVYGSLSDVAYYTGDYFAEWPGFWADSEHYRSVTAKKALGSMVGSVVCQYGRASDDRHCGLDVISIGQTVGTVKKLAKADQPASSYGDSGGGWSFNNTAFGTHYGKFGGYGYFVPVDVAEDALGVTIKLAD